MGRFADIVARAREQAAQAPLGSDPVTLLLGLRRFYKETGTTGIMAVALELGDMAICACPPGDPRRLDVLAESCALFRMAYEEAASPPPEADKLLRKFPQLPELLLRRAIEDGRDAVATAPPEHPAYMAARTHLGNALLTQFQRSGDTSALGEAAARHNEVLERLPPDHPELVTVHANLGNVLRLRAASADDGPALDHAISHYRRALGEAAKRAEPAATIQLGLGEALIMLAARDSNMAAADEAGQMLRAAARALPAHHPALALLRRQLDCLDLANAAAAEEARAEAAAAPAADPADPAGPPSYGRSPSSST
jgi:tetratricopeptide (TPR) repeat protein